jgi:hypothetical protein
MNWENGEETLCAKCHNMRMCLLTVAPGDEIEKWWCEDCHREQCDKG